MPKVIRVILLTTLVTIGYIAISVYFYGKGRTSGGEHLYQDSFTLLWWPLVAFNAWAIGFVLPSNGRVATKWLLAVVVAIMISVAAMLVFMTIAFNSYGS